jgi:hypothetical protein
MHSVYSIDLNKIPWWIVLLLAGSFATAAWWAGELLFNESLTDDIVKPVKIESID